MKEIEINGVEYSILPLDTFSQLTLARKGASIFLGLSSVTGTVGEVYAKAISAFADISEDDFNALIKSVFPSIRRKQDVAWVPVYNKSSNVFLFEDIGSGAIIEILIKAMLEYLPDFFTALNHIISGDQQEVQG